MGLMPSPGGDLTPGLTTVKALRRIGLLDAGWVEAFGRLVEDQQLGIGEQATSDAEALAHAQGVRAGRCCPAGVLDSRRAPRGGPLEKAQAYGPAARARARSTNPERRKPPSAVA